MTRNKSIIVTTLEWTYSSIIWLCVEFQGFLGLDVFLVFEFDQRYGLLHTLAPFLLRKMIYDRHFISIMALKFFRGWKTFKAEAKVVSVRVWGDETKRRGFELHSPLTVLGVFTGPSS